MANEDGSVSELTIASGYGTGLNFSPVPAAFGFPESIALDGSGNVFVSNSGGAGGKGSLGELTAGSTPPYSTALNFAPSGAAFSGPYSVALDGSGNAFVANAGNDSVSEIMGLAEPVVTPLQSHFADSDAYADANSDSNTKPDPNTDPDTDQPPQPQRCRRSQRNAVSGAKPHPGADPDARADRHSDAATASDSHADPERVRLWAGARSFRPPELWRDANKTPDGKRPTIKAVNFGKQALGSSSVPMTRTLTNTTTAPLTVTGVSIKGDFSQNNGCIGQLDPDASCSISIVFTPTHSGMRMGKLTVTTSSSKVTAALAGVGLAPKVISISSKKQTALGSGDIRGVRLRPDDGGAGQLHRETAIGQKRTGPAGGCDAERRLGDHRSSAAGDRSGQRRTGRGQREGQRGRIAAIRNPQLEIAVVGNQPAGGEHDAAVRHGDRRLP